MNIQVFHQALLSWYQHSGRASLPWRQQISAYRVWLSEMMLQQTQVKTVLPYYARFLDKLPDIHALAKAPRDEVLALWSGLGYYSRARYLHEAAQIVSEQHQGQFPLNAEDLIQLPGVGRSTAHAILAIVDNQPLGILDGNVKRILSRLFLIEGPPNQSKTQTVLWEKTQSLAHPSNSQDFTQAMMDLGATVCTRSSPDCDNCPVREHCLAFKTNRVKEFPHKAPKKPLPTKEKDYALVVNDNGEIYLQRRPDKGLWAGLWQCPEVMSVSKQEIVHQLKHTFSHYHLLMRFIRQPEHPKLESGRWFTVDSVKTVGLAKPFKTVLAHHWDMSCDD